MHIDESDHNSTQDPVRTPNDSNQSYRAIESEYNSLTVYIDGPYGAPASQIFRAKHAVLIGTGIGVTPYASILQSIMHRYWQAKITCPKCHYHWAEDLKTSVGLNLRKVTLNIARERPLMTSHVFWPTRLILMITMISSQ